MSIRVTSSASPADTASIGSHDHTVPATQTDFDVYPFEELADVLDVALTEGRRRGLPRQRR